MRPPGEGVGARETEGGPGEVEGKPDELGGVPETFPGEGGSSRVRLCLGGARGGEED